MISNKHKVSLIICPLLVLIIGVLILINYPHQNNLVPEDIRTIESTLEGFGKYKISNNDLNYVKNLVGAIQSCNAINISTISIIKYLTFFLIFISIIQLIIIASIIKSGSPKSPFQ